MVPENIIWAVYSPTEYQNKITAMTRLKLPEPKDVYYQNIKGEWVKVTSVFECVNKLRKTHNAGDVVYLGPVFANTKGEIECGRKYPPVSEDKKTAEQLRKDQIKDRLSKSNPNKYSKILLKSKSGSLDGFPQVKKDLSGFWEALDSDDSFHNTWGT